MGWKPFCLGLLFGLGAATLAVGLYSCGATTAPTATVVPAMSAPTPAATATAVPTVAGIDIPRPTYMPTLPAIPTYTGLEITATALGVRRDGARQATATAGCTAVDGVYAQRGRTFDRAAAVRNPALARIDLRITLFGGADPPTSRQAQTVEDFYGAYLTACLTGY